MALEGSKLSRIFLFVAVLAFIVVGVGITKNVIRRNEINSEIDKLKQDISRYESKSDELTRLLTYLGTDEYKEREARLRLGLKKPNEEVIVIPGLTSKSSQASADSQEQLPNWQRWIKIFYPDFN